MVGCVGVCGGVSSGVDGCMCVVVGVDNGTTVVGVDGVAVDDGVCGVTVSVGVGVGVVV